jgi:SAM-dependent methyltransferase
VTAVSWVKDFYSETGRWWGRAESQITDQDDHRVDSLQRLTGRRSGSVLDLGCAYGNTAAAFARAGFDVTGVEISDRIQFAGQHLDDLQDRPNTGQLDFIQADFNDFHPGRRFDVVAYWNGFGIGSDADQRRLVTRIRSEWLAPDGWVVMDVFNPVRWIAWAGDQSYRDAAPELGYPFSVSESTDYDPIQSRFIDTWTREGDDRRWSQSQRCYSPADLALLLEPTGLRVVAMEVDGESFDPGQTADHTHPLWSHHEYRVALKSPAPRLGS